MNILLLFQISIFNKRENLSDLSPAMETAKASLLFSCDVDLNFVYM